MFRAANVMYVHSGGICATLFFRAKPQKPHASVATAMSNFEDVMDRNVAGAMFEAKSPSTGRVLGQVRACTRDDADAAVAAANSAFPVVAAMTVFERATMLHRIADAIVARKAEIGRVVAEEQGKPLVSEALVEGD